MKKTQVKMCGMRDKIAVRTAIESGAHYIGFIIDNTESIRGVSSDVVKDIVETFHGATAKFVGVFVNRQECDVARIAKDTGIHIIQLHGKEEPKYVIRIKEKTHLQVWKFIEVNFETDLAQIEEYKGVADKIFVDEGKGGGLPIDPKLIERAVEIGVDGIAGGVAEANVQEYILNYHPEIIDVSSGIEKIRGIKSIELIKSFMTKVKETYV